MRAAIARKSTVEGQWRPVFKGKGGARTHLLNRRNSS
jgi:hypothetical protein